jgi:uncharacterized membrane protein YhaH (DUF805 family)
VTPRRDDGLLARLSISTAVLALAILLAAAAVYWGVPVWLAAIVVAAVQAGITVRRLKAALRERK